MSGYSEKRREDRSNLKELDNGVKNGVKNIYKHVTKYSFFKLKYRLAPHISMNIKEELRTPYFSINVDECD